MATGGARDDLAALEIAVHGTCLELSMQRTLYAAEDAAARLRRAQRRALAGAKASRAERSERAARPDDVARLYDTLAANAMELNEVAGELGGARGEALMDKCAAMVRLPRMCVCVCGGVTNRRGRRHAYIPHPARQAKGPPF